jgi:hypothetical protein
MEHHILLFAIDNRGQNWREIAIFNATQVKIDKKTLVLLNKMIF